MASLRGWTLCLLCLFCLDVKLNTAQLIKPGGSCNGEKFDLCEPPAVCEDDQCRLPLGAKCISDRGYYWHGMAASLACRDGLRCSRFKGCSYGLSQDCSTNRTMCYDSYVCDALSRCSIKPGSYCTQSRTNQHNCYTGSDCLKVYDRRFGRRCVCNTNVSTTVNSTCQALAGKVTGACVNDTLCDDPYASCNSSTLRCECGAGTVANRKTLTCDLLPGESCADGQRRRCVYGSICGKGQVCRVENRFSCADGKEHLCAKDNICVDGICKLDFGKKIKRYASGYRSVCRPDAVAVQEVCWVNLGENCAGHEKLCFTRTYWPAKPGICENNVCKLKVNSSRCIADQECPAGSRCVNWKCQCLYTGQSFASSKRRVCGLPQGAVGAQCRAEEDGSPRCSDPAARCKDDKCVCNSGYTEDTNYAKCVLNGPKCTFSDNGKLRTFFDSELPVKLPCRFKMANVKCGGVKAAVYANHSDGSVGGVTVELKKGTSYYKYWLTADMLQSGAWQKSCLGRVMEEDSRTRLTVGGGEGVLSWDKFKVTYTRRKVHVECGHRKFKGVESFPKTLCGSPTETAESLDSYRRTMELESKADLPLSFANMQEEAFSPTRLAERVILYEQNVEQSNPVCSQASAIVKRECVNRAESMYNCTQLFDGDEIFRYRFVTKLTSYPTCFSTHNINPWQMYVSCLKVMCKRDSANPPKGACRDLQSAADQCDATVLRGPSYTDRYQVAMRFMKLTSLLDQHTHCPNSTAGN